MVTRSQCDHVTVTCLLTVTVFVTMQRNDMETEFFNRLNFRRLTRFFICRYGKSGYGHSCDRDRLGGSKPW